MIAFGGKCSAEILKISIFLMKLAKKHRMHSAVTLILAIIAITKPIMFVLILFVAAGAVSTLYKIALNIGLDFELQSFFTVAAGTIYGTKAGFIVGITSVLLAHSINFMLFRNVFLSCIYAISFGILGMLSAAVPFNFVIMASTIYVLANDLLFVFLGTAFGANPAKLIFAAGVHAPFVYIVLSRALMPTVKLFGGGYI